MRLFSSNGFAKGCPGSRGAQRCRTKCTGRRRLRLETLEKRDLLSVTLPGFAVPDYMAYHAGNGAAPMATAGPTGYSPAQIRHAYGFDKITFNNGGVVGDGSGTTIAIVDAFDDPTIASDLLNFDLQFGLLPAGSSKDPNFTKVNQVGSPTSFPQANHGWATEIALDVEWARAIAPKANILLVEANSNSYANLFTAVDYARRQPGVVAVSMSWGGGEFLGETSFDGHFTTPTGHSGVTFLASSGDSGAPPGYPAISPNVVSVGGTALFLDGAGNYSSESSWSGSGGGLSAVESQPAYQNGVVTQSGTRRANPDVAYDSSPSTGFPVYDTFNNPASAPWGQWGGTSAAAPQWAGLVAIADQGRALAGLGALDGKTQTLPMLYSSAFSGDFHDITSGSSSGSPRYFATAGYDLVTGRGTPYADRLVRDFVGTSSTSGTTQFAIAAPGSATAGTAFSITVSALNSSGQTLTSYQGKVHFSSSDGAAALPADYTFTSGDQGVHTFSVTLATSGTQSITVTDTTTSSIVGSTTVSVTPAATGTSTVIESFDSGSSTYNVVGATSPSAYLATFAAHDGTYGLVDVPGSDWIYRSDVQAKRGDTLSVWLQFAGVADGRAYFGFGSSSTGTLSLVAAPNTGQLVLQNNAGYGFANMAAVSQTYAANHWYRLEVDWGSSGTIIGKLFDSDGTTLLRQVQASNTSIAAGGFAFRAISSNNYNKYWDTVRLTTGVNTFAAKAMRASVAIVGTPPANHGPARLGDNVSAASAQQFADAVRSAWAAWSHVFEHWSDTTVAPTPAASVSPAELFALLGDESFWESVGGLNGR